MFVRLDIEGRDIIVKGFGVIGGENGFCNSSSSGGDKGVFGRGFWSLWLKLVALVACLGFRGEVGKPLLEDNSGERIAFRWVSIFVGMCLLRSEIDPSLRMPLRTPDKKSPFSASSSVAESEGVENLESNESAENDISTSAAHSAHRRTKKNKKILPTLKAWPVPRSGEVKRDFARTALRALR